MEDIYKWNGGKWLGLVHLGYYNIRFIFLILFFQKNWTKSWGYLCLAFLERMPCFTFFKLEDTKKHFTGCLKGAESVLLCNNYII